MTDPKGSENQSEELSLEQLEDAAGGAAFIKLGDIKGEYRQKDEPPNSDGLLDRGLWK